eukprot:TRINITY_DN14190_c0_g1_i2.p1 TRINITY_DN14190_c0_g1~~TRINITY_DN14190_c0_g1_i2.p1  ORF type:complete len:879 (-),score=336.10 TRINITY_DN14190_c0_g1_i2:98-2734(-)
MCIRDSTDGMKEAAEEMMSTVDQTKYKTKVIGHRNKDGEYVVKEHETLLQGSADGRIDLPEWLQYLRRLKQEKIQDMMKHPMFTPAQAIEAANRGMDKWFRNMTSDLKVWQEIRRDQQREATRQQREEEMLRKADALVSTPTLTSKSELYNISAKQREEAQTLFRKMDFDKSQTITMDEFEAMFEPARAKEFAEKFDTDTSGSVGIDEFLRFLRHTKRDTVTDSLAEAPEDLDGAVEKADAAIADLFEEITTALQSDTVAEKRKQAYRTAQEMNSDSRRLTSVSSLGGISIPESPAVRKKKALLAKARSDDVRLHYTPGRKLVYDPSNSYQPYSRSTDAPSSVTDWKNHAHKSLVQSHTEAMVSHQAVVTSELTREQVRAESHSMYLHTTGTINARVADTQHAQAALYASLEVAETAIQKTSEATEAVTLMFEWEADALDEILWIKETRSNRPHSERVYDEATLAIQHREEELDPANHEIMLGKLDKLRRALRRLQKKLNNELGSKVISQGVDQEALALQPSSDPPETDSPAPKEITDGAELLTLPKDKALLFQSYARSQLLRGTNLACQPTFDNIEKFGGLMDPAEFKSFCKDFRIEAILDQGKLQSIFHAHSKINKGQLNGPEFVECATALEAAAQALQKNWGVSKPGPTPMPLPRLTSLTVKELAEQKAAAVRPTPLYVSQAIPIAEPVVWKKQLRMLMDETQRHADEAGRLLGKANGFVDEHKNKDREGRNKMLKALKHKTNKLEDQVSKLTESIEHAELDIQADAAELAEAELRQEAVEDFLQVALMRVEKRGERPRGEQVPDPAHHALEVELREGKAELTKLKNDQMRLKLNIAKLQQLCAQLRQEVQDKQAAIDADTECCTRLSVPLVKSE